MARCALGRRLAAAALFLWCLTPEAQSPHRRAARPSGRNGNALAALKCDEGGLGWTDVGSCWAPHCGGITDWTSRNVRAVLADECVLFLGDSLSRRLTGTLAALLLGKFALRKCEPQGPEVSDEPPFGVSHFDEFRNRSWYRRSAVSLNTQTGCLDFRWAPKLGAIEAALKDKRLFGGRGEDYQWRLERLAPGKVRKRKIRDRFLGKASEQRSVDDVFADVRRLFVHGPFAPRLAPELIYRTPPLPDSPETARVKELNARVRGLFRAHGVPFLDHDMIVRPRSLGAGRDAPDHLSKVHLGPMARSVLASSFLNAFKDLRARRRRYNASLP